MSGTTAVGDLRWRRSFGAIPGRVTVGADGEVVVVDSGTDQLWFLPTMHREFAARLPRSTSLTGELVLLDAAGRVDYERLRVLQSFGQLPPARRAEAAVGLERAGFSVEAALQDLAFVVTDVGRWNGTALNLTGFAERRALLEQHLAGRASFGWLTEITDDRRVADAWQADGADLLVCGPRTHAMGKPKVERHRTRALFVVGASVSSAPTTWDVHDGDPRGIVLGAHMLRHGRPALVALGTTQRLPTAVRAYLIGERSPGPWHDAVTWNQHQRLDFPVPDVRCVEPFVVQGSLPTLQVQMGRPAFGTMEVVRLRADRQPRGIAMPTLQRARIEVPVTRSGDELDIGFPPGARPAPRTRPTGVTRRVASDAASR